MSTQRKNGFNQSNARQPALTLAVNILKTKGYFPFPENGRGRLERWRKAGIPGIEEKDWKARLREY